MAYLACMLEIIQQMWLTIHSEMSDLNDMFVSI